MQEKNIQLLELNADIENLINSSPVATLFLEERLHIRRFTPSLRDIISLWESDVGRSITNFSLPEKDFLNDIKSVTDTNKPHRKKIRNGQGRWYLQEIYSYVLSDERKKGVVINYTDITDLHDASDEIEKKSKFLIEILAAVKSLNEELKSIDNEKVREQLKVINDALKEVERFKGN